MSQRKLGPYFLSDVLGRGGMGTVYRAEHEETGAICAVKALAPVFACDTHFRTRFESEIQALIKLDHPNIVRLLGFGQDEGNLFFVMELVKGNSLFQMQRTGHRFDWRECLTIAQDIAAGLRHAHDRGIIHRDLKPGNILRAVDGTNKLTDFGIAKSFGGSQITGDNVLGTMDFMSPEQAKGKPVTAKSDLYSLGTMLFTLLSGRPPFKGNSIEQSMRNLTRVPPPHVSTVAPDVPPEIDKLIRKLMDKDPEKRVPTALALTSWINEIEQKLRDYSQAKTSEQKPAGDTFEVRNPDSSSSQTKRHTGESKKLNAYETTVHSEVSSDLDSGTVDPEQQQDFFNTVSEKHRDSVVEDEKEKQASRGMWPLIFALLGITLLGAYGLYQAYRTPSADNLYLTIIDGEESPNRVREQLGQFINAYPGDDRIQEVRELDSIAKAMVLHKNIGVRINTAGERQTTELEDQFYEIAELSKTDPLTAFSRMSAFLTLHENLDESECSDEDRACLDAARSYLIVIEKDADRREDFSRETIESALARAEQAGLHESREIYNSIMELFKNKEWADDLVERARQAISQ